MKKQRVWLVVLSCIILLQTNVFCKQNMLQQAWDALKGITDPRTVEIYFSPYDDCVQPWTETIVKCSSYVYVSCFGITNKEISDALCVKARTGVRVIVCTDKMQAGNKTAKLREIELRAAGVEYVIKKIQVLEHNKMMFGRSIDGKQYAITGSYNISGNAQSQDNNLQLFQDTYITNKVKAAIERIYNRDK